MRLTEKAIAVRFIDVHPEFGSGVAYRTRGSIVIVDWRMRRSASGRGDRKALGLDRS